MLQFSDYDVVIFDCDGVILNSNTLKIEAMRNALFSVKLAEVEVEKCTAFFAENFGKSRFYHIDYFANHLLNIKEESVEQFKTQLLANYSQQCKSLYLVADVTPFIIALMNKSAATHYVASGSEQEELRSVFKQRQLDSHFNAIYGSPDKKTDLVTRILNKHPKAKAVMIGDAVSDLEAAKDNNIDFIFYRPLSNVKEKMNTLCRQFNYPSIDSFKEVLTK